LKLALLVGCIFSRVEVLPCEDNAVCRDAFGWGSVCGAEGLCEAVAVPARCDRTIPEDLLDNPSAYQDHVLVGSVYDDEAFSLEVNAIELAVAEANGAGGIDGREFGFVSCTNIEDADLDDLDQETANTEMAALLADGLGVSAIVGPATSGRTEAAFLVVEPYDTLIISPSATSPALTDLDGLEHSDASPGLLWRTAPPDSLQGQVIAQDMVERGRHSAAVIYEEGPYGEGLAEVFVEQLEALWTAAGGSWDYELFQFADDNLRNESVQTAGNGDFDEVLFISSEKTDISAFLNAAGEIAGYKGKGIFLADGAFDIEILEDARSAGDLFDQIHGTRPSTPSGEVYEAFRASFSAYWTGLDAADSGFTAYAYDAAWLVLYGAAWSQYQAGEITGTGVAQGLRQVSGAGGADPVEIRPTTWSTARANFEVGRAIDVIGTSGSLDYDPQTEETTAPIDIWLVRDCAVALKPDHPCFDQECEGEFDFCIERTVEP